MKHTVRRLATALVAGAALAATAAAPALAESQSHQDARSDVATLDTSQRKADPKPSIDLVRADALYQGTTLKLSTTGANLLAKGYGVVWLIETEDNSYQLTYDHTRKKPAVDFSGFETRSWSPRTALRAAKAPGCKGAKAKVTGDVVAGIVPRSCLGGADEVRIATLSIEPKGQSKFKLDDARQKGFSETDSPKFGPKLQRN